MIEVSVKKMDANREKQIEIKGHAGYAEHGKDIICAAVSILSQAFLSTLSDMLDYGWILDLEHEIKDGYMKISYKSHLKNVIDLTPFEMYFDRGIDMLIEEYPGYIKRI